jgi:hypothetical protein
VLSTNSADIGLDYAQSDFFLDTVASGQSNVSDLSFRNRSTEGDLYFSMLVRDEALVPIGMLVARYDAVVLRDLLGRTVGLAGPESFAVLVDDRLVQLAHALDQSSSYEASYKLVGDATAEQLAALQAEGRLSNMAGIDNVLNQPDLAAKLAQSDAQPFFTANDSLTGDRLNQVAVTTLTTRPWRVACWQR